MRSSYFSNTNRVYLHTVRKPIAFTIYFGRRATARRKHGRHLKFCRVRSLTIPLLALLLTAALIACQIALASNLKRTSGAAFQTLELKILSADGKQTIGSTRFAVSSDRSNETIKGETSYLDGQRDNEEERIQLTNGVPRLDRYEHSFFGADGSTTMVDKLDTESRTATCLRRENGAMKVRTSELDIPADTFGGGSQLLIVMAKLRERSRKIDFHAFACVPGPRVFHVDALVPRRVEHWPFYPGDLVRVDLRPDLGAGLNLVIAPFLPKTEAWFDPQDNWEYVGGEFNRYFGGPHVFQVLVPPHRSTKSETNERG